MQVETQLPLGKLDPGLRSAPKLDLPAVPSGARELEQLGFDGFVTGEIKTDPFLPLALAATTTERISLTTAVAIAFPRSPTITAMLAWDLQTLSRGRFILGLGTQVKGHIERRYGVPWAPPVPRLREYIRALRAVWDRWQHGTPLDVRGMYYNLSVMVPLFDPGPIEHPRIPIHIAAINEHICRLAGEAGDGIRPHPITTPKFIREVMLPNVARGAPSAGRGGGRGGRCLSARSAPSARTRATAPTACGTSAPASPSTRRRGPTARCSRRTAGGGWWRSSTRCRSSSGGRRCRGTSRTRWWTRSPWSAPGTTSPGRSCSGTATSRRDRKG